MTSVCMWLQTTWKLRSLWEIWNKARKPFFTGLGGFCLFTNNVLDSLNKKIHKIFWKQECRVLTKLRKGWLSCAVVEEQRCYWQVARPPLQNNCNGHLSIAFTYSWWKSSTLKQTRRRTVHNSLIKIWIMFLIYIECQDPEAEKTIQ